MIPNIIFMSYSVGQDSRHEGKATVLRDFHDGFRPASYIQTVRAPNKHMTATEEEMWPCDECLWFSLMYAATGGSTDRPGEGRCFYQPSFRKATLSRSTEDKRIHKLSEVSSESWAARQQTDKESGQTDSVLPELHLLTHLPGLCILSSILTREDNQRHTC